MANYTTLKASVNAYIKANGVRAITGPVLNGILTQMINTLGDGARYGGIATPAGNPGTVDNVVFYLAFTAGTYTNYGGVTLDGSTLHVFVYDGTWADVDTGVPTSTAFATKADKDEDAVEGNIAMFDSNGNPVDGGVSINALNQLCQEVTDLFRESSQDFAISDEEGHDIVRFSEGHIKTKNFDSREQAAMGDESDYDFSVTDEEGNTILGLVGGEIKTRNFDSKKVSNSRVKICSDDVAYAVVGDKLQIYYNSILRCNNYKDYDIDAVCDIGRSFPRYFEVTPVLANVGEHQLTITIKDNNSKEIGKKNIRLVVKSPSTPANPLNVFCIGASTTQGGQWVSELQRRLTGNGGTPSGDSLGNIAMVGRMEVTFNGITTHLEASGGYSFASYISTTTKRCRFNVANGLSVNVSVGDKYSWDGHTFTVQEKNMSNNYFSCDVDDPTIEIYDATGGTLSKVSGDGDATIAFTSARSVGNPFVYNGQVDFAQYITDYCGGRVDVVLANLLINDSYPYRESLEDFSAQFAPMLTFINYMLTAQPNATIGIIVPPLPSQNGGLGHDYGANYPYGLGSGMKVTFQNMHDAVKEFIEQNNLSGSVFMVDFTSVCDSENNFPTEEVPVNPRSSIMELRGINGLHPLLSGYMQMADAAYRMFVNRFC